VTRNEDERSGDSINASPPQRVIVRRTHTIPDRPPIQVDVGQDVEVGQCDTDWPEFVYVTTEDGTGWVPARHLTISGQRGVVHTPYDTTELATEVGDTLEVLAEDERSGWLWCRNQEGNEGWVPIRTIDDAEPDDSPIRCRCRPEPSRHPRSSPASGATNDEQRCDVANEERSSTTQKRNIRSIDE
jgi:hypothetical protein